MQPDCASALATTSWTTYAGELVFILGATSLKTGDAHDECIGPVLVAEHGVGHVYTAREVVDYCIVNVDGDNRRWPVNVLPAFTYTARAGIGAPPMLAFTMTRMEHMQSTGTARAARHFIHGSASSLYIYTCTAPNVTNMTIGECNFYTDNFDRGETLDTDWYFSDLDEQRAQHCVHVAVDWQMLVTMTTTLLHAALMVSSLGYKCVLRVRAWRRPKTLTQSLVAQTD
jgi:hypothetical protein